MITSNFTIITGSGKGLGKALAYECAKIGRNLILTSLPGEGIKQFAEELKHQFNILVFIYEADFTLNGSVEEFATWVSENYKIDMLINNAGLGGTRSFLDVSTDYIDQIVFLNIRALVILTRLLLPELKKHPRAYILNIASMASFGPMPFKTVYPASKAFVYSFTRGLSAELRGTGIVVSVAHPGGMKTNQEVSRRIENHNKLIQSTTLPVQKVAKICVRKLLKGVKLIIPGFMNKLSWVILKLIPVWLRLIIMQHSLKNELVTDTDNIKMSSQKICYENIS